MTLDIVNPQSLPEPRGWNHGLLAPAGARLLFVAGQTAAGGEDPVPPGFARQFARALDSVLAVVREAGGSPDHVARMTVYVTDMAAYKEERREVGAVWRERMGRHFPAMALVAVTELVDEGAVVEIEATAVLEGPREREKA